VISILMAIGFFFCLLMLASGGSHPFAQVSGGCRQMATVSTPYWSILDDHPSRVLVRRLRGVLIPFRFAMGRPHPPSVWGYLDTLHPALDPVRLGSFPLRAATSSGRGGVCDSGLGGYWAWDPVESASFMPWLTGTAFLHSVMIQEKKDMLKVWYMS